MMQILTPCHNDYYYGFWIGFAYLIRNGIFYEWRFYKSNEIFIITFNSDSVGADYNIENDVFIVKKTLRIYTTIGIGSSMRGASILCLIDATEEQFKSIVTKAISFASFCWVE